MCCLRCLRDLEKWSCFEKMGKNGQKWGKIGKNGCPRIPIYTLLSSANSFKRERENGKMLVKSDFFFLLCFT